jgi:hypothetical protein
MNKILELDPSAIHTRNGMLYQGEKLIPLPEADRVANLHGFVHAEHMVNALVVKQAVNNGWVEAARTEYANDDVEIDDNAQANIGEEGTWVSCWVWLSKGEPDDFIPTKEMWDIMDHTAHRAANGLYCGNSYEMSVLVQQGLMESAGRKACVPDEYFKLTARGRQALKERP